MRRCAAGCKRGQMSKYTEEELNRVLSDTGELLKDIPLSQDYLSLIHI